MCSCFGSQFTVSNGSCEECPAQIVTVCSFCTKKRCVNCLSKMNNTSSTTTSTLTIEEGIQNPKKDRPMKRHCNICNKQFGRDNPYKHWRTKDHFNGLTSSEIPEKYCNYGCHRLHGDYKKMVGREEHIKSYRKIGDDEDRQLQDEESFCKSCGGLKVSIKDYRQETLKS